MSFLNALKNGDIPVKNNKKRNSTPYDDFMARKELKSAPPAVSDKINVVRPGSVEEVSVIIDGLKGRQGLVVDLGAASPNTAQRMLDFLSGAVYALDGRIDKLEKKLFLMTPKGVDVAVSPDRFVKPQQKN